MNIRHFKTSGLNFEREYFLKKKFKRSHYTPWRRLGGKEVQLLFILELGSKWGEWSASRPGRALPPGKGPPVPIAQEAGWASRADLDTESRGKIVLPMPGIEPQSPGHPVSIQTLY
jgi:hypothetical protein